MGETTLRDKKNQSTILKNHYFPASKNKINVLVAIQDKEKLDLFIQGLEQLPINALILGDVEKLAENNIGFTLKPKQDLLLGFDCIVTDNHLEGIQSYFAHAITPIVPNNHYLKTILSEFDPLDAVGNSFFYQEDNVWSMYYALIRYMENYKFPYDNRNLIKNVIAL
jgi:hypothetical protein